jgi:hypothetical protein
MAKLWRHQGRNRKYISDSSIPSSLNYFKNKILKEDVDSKCQLCGKKHMENIDDRRMPHFGKECVLSEA